MLENFKISLHIKNPIHNMGLRILMKYIFRDSVRREGGIPHWPPGPFITLEILLNLLCFCFNIYNREEEEWYDLLDYCKDKMWILVKLDMWELAIKFNYYWWYIMPILIHIYFCMICIYFKNLHMMLWIHILLHSINF